MTRGIAKTLLDTLELRKHSVITESEIAALKKRWRPLGRDKLPPLWPEYELFREALPMHISREQADRGAAYLRKLLLCKDGGLRQTALVKRNSLHAGHAKVLANLERFELHGFAFESNVHGLEWPYPIYRAIASDGSWFEYIAKPWQAGECEFSATNIELQQ